MAAFIPRWLKLKDAAKYASIGEKRLRSLVESGTIRGIPDPGTKSNILIIDRESIDAYWDSLMGSDPVKIALAEFRL